MNTIPETKKDLFTSFDKLRNEIISINKDLNRKNDEKESWFRKKDSSSKEIRQKINFIKESKQKRDILTKKVKELKEKRDSINKEINKKIKASDAASYTISSIYDLIKKRLEKDEFVQKSLSDLKKQENLTDPQVQEIFHHLCMNSFINGVRQGYSEPIIPMDSIFEEEKQTEFLDGESKNE